MALVTGLLLLAVISVLAVTAAGSMTLQQHQAANFSDRMLASSGADLAGSYALAWLFSREDSERQAGCVSDCLLPPGVYGDEAIPDHPEFESLAWWRSNGTPAGKNPVSGEFVGFVSGETSDAMWVMEEVHFEPSLTSETSTPLHGVAYYRIFSRGSGKHPGSTVVTETIVARPWGPDIVAAHFPPDLPMAAFCDQTEEGIPCGTLAWRRRR
jgi:hypothetical protein